MSSVKRRSKAIPAKVIRLPRSAGISTAKAMAIYRAQVKRNLTPVLINQRNVSIGTNNSWFNAQVIARDPAWVDVPGASYVWYSGNLSSENAIISRRFTLSPGRSILSASLFLSVDNYAVVIINGVPLLFDGPQNTPSFFNPGRSFNIRGFVRRGRNDIVIIAFNFGGARSPSNPAGVAARLDFRLGRLR
ncbi:hypothetical protein [Paenibacillus sp. y28]|uniref:hypothetical protein n=1 Tax=Paenibacillus sp. y28 TaxID=3129110 RepID=UPI0030191BFC